MADNYKGVNLKNEDWEYLRQIADEVSIDLNLPEPMSIPKVIRFCANFYQANKQGVKI